MQIILYLLVIIGKIIVTCCLYCLKTGNRSAETDMSAETKNEFQIKNIEAKWKERTGYHAVVLFSCTFWVYGTIMSIIAQSFQQHELEDEILEIYHRNSYYYRILYALTPLILAENILSLFLNPGLWYLWYFIMMVMKKKCTGKQHKIMLHYHLVTIFSVFLAVSTLAVHFNHIVIGFIHTEYHATAVGVFYAFFILLLFVMYFGMASLFSYMVKDRCALKDLQSASYNKYDLCYILACGFATFGLIIVIGFIAALYFLLPIRNAIDDAPNRLNTISTTLILAFGGYAIFLLQKSKRKKKIMTRRKSW